MNILLSLILLASGIYLLYRTYKKPSPRFSTDLKGYFGGIGIVCLSIISLIGKFNLFEMIKEILSIK